MNEANRNYLATLTFIALLMLGPIQPYGLAIRIAYLVVVPVAVWFGLEWSSGRWPMDEELNGRINRALTGAVSGICFALAYYQLTRTNHVECSHWIQTRDGQECVGDDVVVQGGDFVGAAILLFFGCLAFWIAIFKDGSND